MFDKTIAIDKYMVNSFNDKILSSIYTALSSESRKLLLNGYNAESNNLNDNINFHRLIGFQLDDVDMNAPVTNELILNLCNNFIKLDDRNYS
jgi:hypothetical protein